MRAHEFLPEKVNAETLKPWFHNERTLPNGMLMTADGNDQGTGVIIKIFHPDNLKKDIAFTRFVAKKSGMNPFSAPNLEASFVYVDQEYRRQGLARLMYKYAQELGNDIRPSHAQTPAGHAMWQGFKGEFA